MFLHMIYHAAMIPVTQFLNNLRNIFSILASQTIYINGIIYIYIHYIHHNLEFIEFLLLFY
jgi:hypothetical protein